MELNNEWIVGFVDGDGCFKKYKTETGFRYCFIVSQDQRSVSVLYALKEKFGCGSVHKAGNNMREYKVSNKKHLIETILPFFLKNPLQTQKRNDFLIFLQDLMPSEINKLILGSITRDWLVGFIDAEGCFYTSIVENYPRPQFVIGLHNKEIDVLEKIKAFISSGIIYQKTSKQKSHSVYQISNAEGFDKIIKLCVTGNNRSLLKTSKRISFLKFKKIIYLIQAKKHLTEEGKVMIEKIKKSAR
jgi:hypothetical protein